jgi:deoxyribonuclease IV
MKKIYTQKWCVGAHTAFSGSIAKTIRTSIDYGMYTTQFFLGNPKTIKRTIISEKDIEESKQLIEQYPTSIFSHFPYIANLAGKKNELAWTTYNDNTLLYCMNQLEYELQVLSNFKVNGVVIHPGNYKDRKIGLKTIAKTINKLKFPENSRLLLENSAGEGTKLPVSLTEMKEILSNIEEEKLKHVGVCLDTCHLFASGEYDLCKISEVKRLFNEVVKEVGIDKFWLLHLNDSEKDFGSKVDRHACIGTGRIWENGFDSLIYLLDKCEQNSIPIVLETHGLDMITLSCLKK